MIGKIIDMALTFADHLAGEYNRKHFGPRKPKGTPSKLPEKFKNASEEFIENARQQSMKDSQGVSDYSGSSYNGPGKPDWEKRTFNKAHRHD